MGLAKVRVDERLLAEIMHLPPTAKIIKITTNYRFGADPRHFEFVISDSELAQEVDGAEAALGPVVRSYSPIFHRELEDNLVHAERVWMEWGEPE